MDQAAAPEQVDTQIPEAARGLCWGGFFLNWIWAIGNRTWIGLLVFVPFLGVAIPFVLLFKGREWAWKNKSWRSVEHFNSTQRTWSIVGAVFICFIPLLGVLAAIAVPNFNRFQMKAEQSEAKIALAGVYTAEKMAFADSGAYSSNFSKLGFDTSNFRRYRIGFASTGPEFAKLCRDCNASGTTFKAIAIGEIGVAKKLDVWTINQDKQLVQVVNAFE